LEIWASIILYFENNMDAYLIMLRRHIGISLRVLAISILIGCPMGALCVIFKKQQKWIVGLFQMLRIIPSLAVLVLSIRFLGIGMGPAITALVFLAVPPILMNTMAGLEEVPFFMLETAKGMGMTPLQVWSKVRLPLALPLVLAGVKTATVEIIASTTIAALIGAGGLGQIVFQGLSVRRTELLLVGGISVAVLSLVAVLLLDLLDRFFQRKGFDMKNKLFKLTSAVLIIFSFGLITTACTGSDNDVIRVGSKDFTESLIIAEIYSLALEAAGFTVDRTGHNLASGIVHTAIVNGEIDLYPEYTGTGLLTVLGLPLMTDPIEVYELVKREYYERYQITWLDLTQAHNGQGIAIRTSLAQELGIVTISDLQPHAHNLRFVSTAEFIDREDGLSAMVAAFGAFDFYSVNIMGGGARYEALRTNAADVSVAFTTDGHLYNTHYYTLLVEDIVIWPPYNLVPIVRNTILEERPGVADALNRLAPHITTAALLHLNSQVIVYGQDIQEVAREFFESLQ